MVTGRCVCFDLPVLNIHILGGFLAIFSQMLVFHAHIQPYFHLSFWMPQLDDLIQIRRGAVTDVNSSLDCQLPRLENSASPWLAESSPSVGRN